MSEMRNTGDNKLSRNGERLDTYGHRNDGRKEKIVTRTDGSKVDKYWGGQGKLDGSGHGHEWNNKKNGDKGSCQPNR